MEPDKEEENKTGKGKESPKMVIEVRVVKEEPTKEEDFIKRHAYSISLTLVAAFLAILLLSASSFDQQVQSQVSGSYTVTRELMYVSDVPSFQIDEYNNLEAGIMGGSHGEIMVTSSLASRMANPSGSYDKYRIETITIKGKKTQIVNVNEIIVPETTIVAIFSDPNLELGHTLNIEIGVRINKSSSSSGKLLNFNVAILRDSKGKIYHVDNKGSMPQEPGFEIFLAFSAIIIIAIAVRRKKE